MTLQEKLNEIAHYDRCSFNMIARKSAVKMYDWTAKQAEKAFCELCQTKGLPGCNGNGCDRLKSFKIKINES